MAGRGDGFDPEQYEQVKVRIPKFWADYPNGRIDTNVLPAPEGEWIIKAEIWSDRAETAPTVSGIAQEVIGAGPVNKTNALENCETSAIGRALANWKYVGDKKQRASAEEMAKVQRGPVEKKSKRRLHPELESIGDAIRKIDDRELRTEIAGLLRGSFGPSDQIPVEQIPEVAEAAFELLAEHAGLELHGFVGQGQFEGSRCEQCGGSLSMPWHYETNEEPFELTGNPPPVEEGSGKPPPPYDTSAKAKIKMHDSMSTWSADEVDEALAGYKLPKKGTLAQRRIAVGNARMLAGEEPEFRAVEPERLEV